MVRRSPGAWCLFVGLTLAGCRMRNTALDGARPSENTAGVGSSSPGGSADGTVLAGPRPDRVSIHTDDGWTLVGDLSTGAPSRPAVILLHQLSSNRSEWAPLVARLHSGIAYPTLAIDGRGHGESVQGPDGVTSWQQFGSASTRWDGLRRDLAAAVSYLRGQHLDGNGFVLVGSSIGSTAAVREAADERGVRALVMLSPGLDYRGLDTLDPLTRYSASGRPVFLVASDGDTGSAESLRTLATHARTALALGSDAGNANGTDAVTDLLLAGTGAHGVSMAAPGVHPELWERIATWLDRVMAAPAQTVGQPGEPIPSTP